ncbi:MAG: phosphatase PAP2 family protein [Candidatus Wildermuthbacteria bacterium]|nr:phosphatase PAP2 family protein [Candidatus Wildermuthbacteria bacterium]
MGRVNLFLRFFVRPEIFLYVALFLFTAAFFVLSSLVQNSGPASQQGGQDILKHYVNLNGARVVWTFILFSIGLFAHGVVLWAKAALQQTDPLTVFTRQNAVRFLQRTRTILRDVIVVGIPFALAFYSMSMALGPLNVFNATRLRDELLFTWDTFLTGTFPPLSLASFQYPNWFISAVEFSFFYLVPALTIFGAYLLVARPRLFREAAGAFFLSAMIMFAGWTLFPVLSPYYRFVTDEYNLSVPAQVQQYVDGWHPQEEIAAFWEKIDATLKDAFVLPTTAIPSAHVVWAVFLAYYSYRVSKWLLLVSVPFTVLSTIGTNLFAAHYFVDIIAGLLCGGVAIWAAHFLAKKSEVL